MEEYRKEFLFEKRVSRIIIICGVEYLSNRWQENKIKGHVEIKG
jgi:hypothetical protein